MGASTPRFARGRPQHRASWGRCRRCAPRDGGVASLRDSPSGLANRLLSAFASRVHGEVERGVAQGGLSRAGRDAVPAQAFARRSGLRPAKEGGCRRCGAGRRGQAGDHPDLGRSDGAVGKGLRQQSYLCLIARLCPPALTQSTSASRVRITRGGHTSSAFQQLASYPWPPSFHPWPLRMAARSRKGVPPRPAALLPT